ncbi:MAG: hypothetical protein EAZ46_11980 [Runella sp.]|nr:MAG: hypothetical protein EAZ46_11980 [Runella sp.]
MNMYFYSNPYYKAIDPVDEGYSPFSDNHLLTLIFYWVVFVVSVLTIWSKRNQLSPLVHAIALIFILIGIFINFIVVFHISMHYDARDEYNEGISYPFFFMPIMSIIIGIILLLQSINNEIDKTLGRTYNNQYLNAINTFLADKYNRLVQY